MTFTLKYRIKLKKRQGRFDGIYFLFIFYFIYEILFDCFLPGSVLMQISPYILFGLELFSMLYLVRCSRWKLRMGPEAFAALIICVGNTLLTARHTGPVDVAKTFANQTAIFFVCCFFTTYRCSEEGFYKILKIIAGFAVAAILYSVVLEGAVSTILHMSNAYAKEITSFWYGKNPYGRFLYIAEVCAFTGLVLDRYQGKSGFRWTAVCVVIFAGIIFTFSRTALLTVSVFFAMYLILTTGNHKLRNVLIAVLVAGILLFMFSDRSIMAYLEKFIFRNKAGLAGREDIWKVGVDYIMTHPFLGTGEYMADDILHAAGLDHSEFHNAYIYRMITSGLLLSLLYVYLWGMRLRKLWRSRRKNPAVNCSLALAVSLLVYMLAEQYSYYRLILDGLLISLFLYAVPLMNLRTNAAAEQELPEKIQN